MQKIRHKYKHKHTHTHPCVNQSNLCLTGEKSLLHKTCSLIARHTIKKSLIHTKIACKLVINITLFTEKYLINFNMKGCALNAHFWF